MKKIYLILLLISFPELVFAQNIEGDSLGKIFANVEGDMKTTGGLWQIICYLVGLILAILGLKSFKDYGDQPAKVGLKDPISKLVAGAFFIVLPTFIDVVTNTIFDGTTGGLNIDMTSHFKN